MAEKQSNDAWAKKDDSFHSEKLSLSEALTKSWNIFTQNAITILVVVLFPLLATIGVALVTDTATQEIIAGNGVLTGPEDLTVGFFVWVLSAVVLGVISTAVLISVLLEIIAKKRTISVSEAFSIGLPNIGRMILASLLIGLIVVAGLIALVIPGIIAGFLLVFGLHAAIDQKKGAVAAMKSSYEIVRRNKGTVFITILAIWAITFAYNLFLGILLLPQEDYNVLKQVASGLLSAPVSAWSSTVLTLLYLSLKSSVNNNTDS